MESFISAFKSMMDWVASAICIKMTTQADPSSLSQPNMDILEGVLQYLPHDEVIKCRTVCSRWNVFIEHYSASFKQRLQFDYFGVGHYSNIQEEAGWRQWQDIPHFKECCKKELEPFVEAMVGKLMQPRRDAEETCRVLLRLKEGQDDAIVLNFPNEFTRESAFDLLHFLKHLSGTAIKHADFRCEYRLSIPAEFFCQINCELFILFYHNRLFELKEISRVFPSPRTILRVRLDRMQQALDYIATMGGSLLCPMVLAVMISEQREFDEALEYFRTHDVRSIIHKAMLSLNFAVGGWNRWPCAPFDPSEAIKYKSCSCPAGCDHYSLSFHNTQSGEPYRAVLHVKPETQIMNTVSLVFKKRGGQ